MRRAVPRRPRQADARVGVREDGVRLVPSRDVARADVVLDEIDRRPAPAELRRRGAEAARAAGLVRVPRRRDRQQDGELDSRDDEPDRPPARAYVSPSQ
jgi:hypothetical protein